MMTAAPPTTTVLPDRIALLETPGFAGYALIDSGAGRKLERFGDILVDRPEPQALWQPRLDRDRWLKAHAVFSASGEDDEKGRWRSDKPVPDAWPVVVDVHDTAADARAHIRATMLCRLSAMWHLGLFPEQMPHWQWMVARLRRTAATLNRPPRLLNLFAYTGAASLLAAAAGAEVTHVDASKKAVAWARENQQVSNLTAAPIRWIIDDAAKFAAREVRRGRTYDMILVDPPKFGRGPGGEIWDLFTHLPGLLGDLSKLLDPARADLVLTVYAIRASTLAFGQLFGETLARDRSAPAHGRLEAGELAIRETGGANEGARLVPTSLYVRWSHGDA